MPSINGLLNVLARRGAVLVLALGAASAGAAGGPFGIDHRIGYDNSGIWNRNYQLALQDLAPTLVLATALWQGDNDRLGHTSWQSLDAMILGTGLAEGMKFAFSRARPNQSSDPNKFFQGSGNRSFPSAEVMGITTAVTPYILEYGDEHPIVWALALLPAYDAVARVKARDHWQSDVLTSLLLGTAIGYYTHSRSSSLTVGVLPGGFTVGWKKSF